MFTRYAKTRGDSAAKIQRHHDVRAPDARRSSSSAGSVRLRRRHRMPKRVRHYAY